MPVRTALLARGLSGTANVLVTVYTCPTGKTAILKDIRILSAGSAVTNAVVRVTSGSALMHIVDQALVVGDPVVEQGFVVLEPGDQVKIVCTATDAAYYRISGAELDGVAP